MRKRGNKYLFGKNINLFGKNRNLFEFRLGKFEIWLGESTKAKLGAEPTLIRFGRLEILLGKLLYKLAQKFDLEKAQIRLRKGINLVEKIHIWWRKSAIWLEGSTNLIVRNTNLTGKRNNKFDLENTSFFGENYKFDWGNTIFFSKKQICFIHSPFFC